VERLSEMAARAQRAIDLDHPPVNRANLLYMPTEHQPVLAAELTELLAPEPGQTAVDCTFGGGGHARRIAAALGPSGTLICIDRDPAAEARYEAFAAEAPCATRFVATDFAAGLRTLRGEAEAETDGREGLRSLELLIALYKSARDGRRINLPLEY